MDEVKIKLIREKPNELKTLPMQSAPDLPAVY
jgi:hypothetical protein